MAELSNSPLPPNLSEADAASFASGDKKRVPLGQRVARALRRAVLSGRYKAGERLVEDRLSEDFKVSRVPVREALKTLAAEGLVVLLPRRGARVAGWSKEFALELVEVRATLEGLNARLAARRHDPAIITRLRDVLERGIAAAERGSPVGLARLNSEYHELLAMAGNNRVLQDTVRSLRERTEMVFLRNTTERAPEDWREHAAILSAIVSGDEELAALLATRHVHSAARDRLARQPFADAPRARESDSVADVAPADKAASRRSRGRR